MEAHLGESKFWPSLWRHYGKVAPSIALCRVPELEYASSLKLEGSTLDHCCGDGLFASLAWPNSTFSAGCDISEPALVEAKRLGRHDRLDAADAGKKLPYEDASFDLVFDNSALEHILDLQGCLVEVARVTKPGGLFAFNVLGDKYFDWWPLDQEALEGYKTWQPFHHALSVAEWTDRLAVAGFSIESISGYFGEEAARLLATLDCEFSGAYMANRPSQLVDSYRDALGRNRRRWRKRIDDLVWQADVEDAAGYYIVARKV